MATTRRKRAPTTPPRHHPNADVVAEGRRACPICGATMQTRRRGDDAIDVCEEHGVWLDRYELERMSLRKAKAAGRRARAAQVKGRLEGLCWGLLS